ncbi:hypothetical protein G3M48_000147 [Beauveria asiatica]|uniref:non-specific serine/threonine protein kinase n=1 Tax=Beauveria asiatica TaxID=1069075 RepID=A0AAW0S164_9HYPO
MVGSKTSSVYMPATSSADIVFCMQQLITSRFDGMDNSHRMPDQYDLFLYTGNERVVEDLTKYKHNGFHPIVLGDVLPKPDTSVGNPDRVPRYRILLKLGFGAFATVWLARDLTDKRYVSLKICLGTDAPELGNEAALLSELRNLGQGKAGFERIIQLFDVFTRGRMDPHLANFGVALPQLEQFSEDDIIDYFANPEIIPVVPRDTSFSMSSLPPYVTLRVSMADFLHMMKSFPAEPTMSIKILDFGRAHRTSEKLTTLPGAAPKLIRPPEVVVYDDFEGRAGSVWSKSADIWAVGCTVYQIYYRTSYELISTWGSHNDFILRTLQLGGPPPDGWPGIWNTRSGHGNGMLHLRSWLL